MIHPFGPHIDNFNAAMISKTIADVSVKHRLSIEDFYPSVKPKKTQSIEEIRDEWKAWAASFKGE